MVIRKQYNIGQLAEQLQTEVEKSKKSNTLVRLDILTANSILDVLNETNKREQKNHTLESTLTFIEKEDGTQTNLMEEHNKKPECFGRYYINCKQCDNIDCNVRADCISTTKGNKRKLNEGSITEQKTEHYGCFGKYDEDDLDCLMCECSDKCLKETERTEIVRVSYCSEVGCEFNSATKCITTPEMWVQNNECMSNTCSTRYLIPDDNIVSEDEEEGETNE